MTGIPIAINTTVQQNQLEPTLRRIVELLDRLDAQGRRASDNIASRLAGLVTGPLSKVTGAINSITSSIFSLQSLFVTGAGAAIVKTFADFDLQLARVSAQASNSKVPLKELSDEVRRIGLATGESFTDLNKALLETVSSGIEASKALKLIDVAAQTAVAGGSDALSVTKGLLTIIHSFGLEVSQARDVTDLLFQSMKTGRATIEEMSRFLGLVAPVARQAGLSLDETVAAVNALTQSGLSTERAVTALRSTIQGLIDPSDKALRLVERLNKETDKQFSLSPEEIKGGKFIEFIKKVQEATKGNAVVIEELFGNIRAYTAIASLGADGSKNLAENLELLKDKVGATQVAFDLVSDRLGIRISKLKNELLSMFITVGAAAEPFVKDIIDVIAGFLRGIANAENTLRAIFTAVVDGFKALGRVFSTVFRQGDLFQFVTNLITSLFKLVARLAYAGFPVLFATVQASAKELARQIVHTIINTSTEEMVKLAPQSGLTRAGLRLIFGGDEGGRLIRLGGEIKNQTEAIQQFTTALIKAQAQLERFDAEKKGVGEFGPDLDVARARAALVQTVAFNQAELARLTKEREDNLSKVRAKAIEETTNFSDAQVKIGQKIKELNVNAGGILKDAVKDLGVNLSNPSRAAIDNLVDVITRQIPESFRSARTADKIAAEAKRVKEEAARKVALEQQGPPVPLGLQEPAPRETDILFIRQKVREAIAEAQAGLELLNRKRQEALQLKEAGFITTAEGRRLEAQAQEEFLAKFVEADKALEAMRERDKDGILSAALQEDVDKLEELRLQAIQVRNVLEGAQENFGAGLEAGIRGVVTQMDQLNEVGKELGATLVRMVSDFAIAVAEGKKSFSDFAITYLKLIGNMILQAAIFRVISGAFGFGGPAPGGDPNFIGPPAPKAGGGFIHGPYRGYDSVHILAQPGEYMLRESTAAKLGPARLDAINRMLVPAAAIDPYVSGAPPAAAAQEGLQQGGAVTSGGWGRRSEPVPAYILPTEQAADHLLNGSSRVFERYNHQRRGALGLGSGRTR